MIMGKRKLQKVLLVCFFLVFLYGCGKKDEAAEYVEQGMSAFSEGDLAGAKAALSEAEKRSPGNAKVLRALGIVACEEEAYEEAVEKLAGALSALGEDGNEALREDILKYKADAEIKSGAFSEAKADYDKLIALDNEHAEYYLLRGRVLLELEDTEGALKDFRTAVSASAGNPDYCEDIYVTLKEHGAGEAGLEFLDLIISAGPSGDTDSGRYGRACLEKVLLQIEGGQYEEALSLIGEALSKAEELAKQELYYAEGVCYEKLLDFETALEKFRAYREAYGADGELDHEIAFLETRVALPEAPGVETDAAD